MTPKLTTLIALAILILVCDRAVEAVAQTTSSRRNQPKAPATSSDSQTKDASGDERITERPNIILINLDDADVDIFADDILDRYLPNIKKLATSGMRFTNCHVTTPLCGPSRACLLLGQHAHRTGIKTNLPAGKMNNGFSGAYDLFKSRGFEEENLGVWMHRAGYRTMMIGKYSHGQMNPVGIPGWDDLFICFGGNYFKTSRYSSRLPLELRRRATGENEYRTVVETSEAVGMIERQVKRNKKKRQPFFLYIAPLAPHLPARKSKMLEEKYREIGKEIRVPNTPDFNEADISDKPAHLQSPKLTEEQIAGVHEEHRRRVVSTKSVDDMVGRLFEVLNKTRQRENTYIFFTSDHGYQNGHNRMIAKKLPYSRNTMVPMFVVGPEVAKGSSDHLLAHIDLTTTFLDIAEGSSPLGLDGKSILPLMRDPDSIQYDEFRKSLLIQCWEEKSMIGTPVHCRYASLRTRTEIFTQWANGVDEYYDLTSDPYQVENKFKSLSMEKRHDFEERLRLLKDGVPKPIATVSNREMVSRSVVLKGVAEDDNSVEQVLVQIENPAKRLFWDGKAWQAQEAFVTPRLANSQGLITDWSYSIDLTPFEHDGEVVVRAKAMDDQANVSDLYQRILKVDAIDPTTVLILPKPNAEVQSPVTIRGECSDNHAMTGIELTLQRIADNKFWDGTNWTSGKTTFLKRVVKKNWHVRIPVETGKYVTTARALDQAGNYDPVLKRAEFSVK